MVFWLFLILTAIGIGIALFGDCDAEFWGVLIALIFGITALAMLCVIFANCSTAPGVLASNRERYEALVFKAESEEARDEFGVLNSGVLYAIQKWNEDLAYNKEMQRNFWVGIFIPNIYDEFERIDYEVVKLK